MLNESKCDRFLRWGERPFDSTIGHSFCLDWGALWERMVRLVGTVLSDGVVLMTFLGDNPPMISFLREIHSVRR